MLSAGIISRSPSNATVADLPHYFIYLLPILSYPRTALCIQLFTSHLRCSPRLLRDYKLTRVSNRHRYLDRMSSYHHSPYRDFYHLLLLFLPFSLKNPSILAITRTIVFPLALRYTHLPSDRILFASSLIPIVSHLC